MAKARPAPSPAAATPAGQTGDGGSVTKQIGATVRRLRSSLGLTLGEVARRANLSAAMLSRLENGGVSPSLESLAALTGAHSLAYLSLGGLQRAVDAPAEGFCRACFTGDYPIPIPDSSEKLRFEARGETTVAVPVP